MINSQNLMYVMTCSYIPYSRKYWRELNLAVGSPIAIANILADLNLAVRYGIAIHIYASKKFWRILIWQLLEQTAKPPNLIPRQIFRLYGMPGNITVESHKYTHLFCMLVSRKTGEGSYAREHASSM